MTVSSRKLFLQVILVGALASGTIDCFADMTPQYTQSYESGFDYADDLIEYLSNIREHYPALSPSQIEWMENERSVYKETRNWSRFRQARESEEFSIARVIRPLDILLGVLRDIKEREVLNSLAKISGEDQKPNASRWAFVANQLLSTQLWQQIYKDLEKKPELEEFLCGDPLVSCDEYLGFYLNFGVNAAQSILRSVF